MWIVGKLAAGVAAAVVLVGCGVDDDEFGVAEQGGASGGGVGGAAGKGGFPRGGGGSGDASACAAAPCMNGGECTDLGSGRYQCACAPGYDGTRCEIDIDDCAGMPCQNGGECVDGNGRYTCACETGFSGLTCERAVAGCEDAPCLNGECSDTSTGYTCACADGFTGNNCEIDIDECQAQPCKNDGECIDGVNARTCKCKDGWSGADCAEDIDECEEDPCQNGGECKNLEPGFECECPAEWTGKTCELDVDECASASACPAGRTCVNEDGGHECPCAPGGVGPDCERIFDILPVVEHYHECTGMDVSADGSVVVGFCSQSAGSGRVAFRWSEATGIEALKGDLLEPGARSVSDDGSVVAGFFTGGSSGTAFRWTRSTGMVNIGISGNVSMNADGSVIAGGSIRWTPTGTLSISPLIDAHAMSDDGNVIVGPGPFGDSAMRWTPSSADELPVPSGADYVAPLGISADGSTIVGRADYGNTVAGIVWRGTKVTSSSAIPQLVAISGDGSVIVSAPAGTWDETRGVRDLRQLVSAQGAEVPESKVYASAISRDGRYIVGEIQVTNQPHRAFRAKLP